MSLLLSSFQKYERNTGVYDCHPSEKSFQGQKQSARGCCCGCCCSNLSVRGRSRKLLKIALAPILPTIALAPILPTLRWSGLMALDVGFMLANEPTQTHRHGLGCVRRQEYTSVLQHLISITNGDQQDIGQLVAEKV
jgi:hypothetical protein